MARSLLESIADYLPEVLWQRCMVHFCRNVFSHVPSTKFLEIAYMLKVIHAQESRPAAQDKAEAVIAELRNSSANSSSRYRW